MPNPPLPHPEGKPFEMKAADIPLVTNSLSAPTFYTDDIRGVMVLGSMAKLNFIENRVDALTGEVVAIHVATIVVPVDQARNWGTFLTKTFPPPEAGGEAAEDAAPADKDG